MSQVRFHPTQRVLLATCVDRRIAIWNLDDQEATVKNLIAVPGTLACPHEASWVRSLEVSPDGTWVATGGADRDLPTARTQWAR